MLFKGANGYERVLIKKPSESESALCTGAVGKPLAHRQERSYEDHIAF
jgi:hypothetical protein